MYLFNGIGYTKINQFIPIHLEMNNYMTKYLYA